MKNEKLKVKSEGLGTKSFQFPNPTSRLKIDIVKSYILSLTSYI